jgi:hypothetical protein
MRHEGCKYILKIYNTYSHVDKISKINKMFGSRGCGGIDRIQLAQDRDRWRTLVDAVID